MNREGLSIRGGGGVTIFMGCYSIYLTAVLYSIPLCFHRVRVKAECLQI